MSTSRPVVAARGEWFRQAKFAMFMHWGLYSQAAGVWHGRRYHGIGEWLMYRARIPVREYETLAAHFNPVRFRARQWARIARDAGMRYLVITAKHHDGFAMFRSQASPYSIADATPFGRDPLAELAEACQAEGLRLGFYYSQWQDWHAAGGAGNGWDPQPGDFETYFRGKCLPQVRELLSNYGPLALIWFDTPGSMSREHSQRLVDAVRELQPDCLINSRIGNDVGDYETLGDQEIPLQARGGLWEAVDTHNDTWGYVAHDHHWKSAPELVERLVRVAAKGGNYMLNVGPTGLGEIPAPSVRILGEVGDWTRRHAEALYGAGPSPFGRLAWGDATTRAGKVYLHVLDLPKAGPLLVPGVRGPVTHASVLGQPRRRLPVSTTAVRGALAVTVSPAVADPAATVVVLHTPGPLRVDPTQAILPAHRNDLLPPYAQLAGCALAKLSWMEKFGDWKHADCVTGWHGPESVATWTFRVLQPGPYCLELDYSCREPADGTEGLVTLGRREYPFPVLDTGERAGPLQHHGLWPLFRVYRIGLVDLPRAGRCTLALRPSQPVEDEWLRLRAVSLLPVQA